MQKNISSHGQGERSGQARSPGSNIPLINMDHLPFNLICIDMIITQKRLSLPSALIKNDIMCIFFLIFFLLNHLNSMPNLCQMWLPF